MASNAVGVYHSSVQGHNASPYQCQEEFGLLMLPEEIIFKILSYFDYHEISETRNICHTLNKYCQQILNQGFSKVDKLHAQIQKRVKSQLPRRESERRNHPLARHVDILSAIETRLSLLGMTYTRYIDMGLCCFLPGKVLDELFKILLTLQRTDQPPRAHEFLQELRDISSMAMEHFEEKISPALKAKMPAVTLPFPFADPCGSPEPQPGPSTQVLTFSGPPPMRGSGQPLRQEIGRMQLQVKSHNIAIAQCRRETHDCKKTYIEQSKKLTEQNRKIQAQAKTISEQAATITEHEKKLNDLNKKILEYDQKFADVYSELSKMKGESLGNPSTFKGTSFLISQKEQEEESDKRKERDNLKRPALRADKAFKHAKKPRS